MTQCWKMLSFILGEGMKSCVGTNQSTGLTEGHFLNPYIMGTSRSPEVVDIRKRFIKGALNYLNAE
jgi:hypothetical protein